MRLFILFGSILLSFAANSSNVISGEELFVQPYFSLPKISPNGKYIVARVDDGDSRELIIFDLEKEERHPVVFFAKKNHLRDFYWIDSDSIYIEYTAGDESRQSIIDLDTNNLHEKSPAVRVKSSGYLLDSLSHLNDEVLFIKESKKTGLEIFQIRTDELLRDDFSGATLHRSHLNNALSYFYDSDTDTFFSLTIDRKKTSVRLWYLLQDQNDWQELYSWSDFDYEFEPISYLDNSQFLVLTNKDTDHIAAAVFDTKSQTIVKLLYEHPAFDLTSAEYSMEANQLASISYLKHGRPVTEYLTQSDSTANAGNAFEKKEEEDQYFAVDVAFENENAILMKYGPASPGTFLFFDASGDTIRFLEHAYPNLSDIEFAATEHFDVKVADETTIEALLNRPAINSNGVLLVMPHGGPIGFRDYDSFSQSVQFFTNRGYSTLRVNFRGSAGFGKTFQEQGVGEFGKLIEQDITKALHAVLEKYSFNKTCTLGSSYGGYSAFMLPILHPQEYDCIVALFGIYDLPLLLSSSNFMLLDLVQDSIKAIVGEDASELSSVSPVYLLDDLNIPILLVAGLNDEIAVIEHSNRMKYMLQKHGIDFESLFFRNEAHGMKTWFGEQQLHAVIDDFLRRKLALPLLETIGSADQVAAEYIKISDIFDFNTLTENDNNKAFEYYRKAAQLGHERAVFNIGSYYHRGEIVDEDIDEAASWYDKASELGYSSASYRLGLLYEEGTELQKDIPKAIEYYQRAKAQGFDARAGLKLAQYVCTGEYVALDIEQCMANLSLEEIKRANAKSRKKLVTGESMNLRTLILPTLMLSDDIPPELQSFYDEIKRVIYKTIGSDLKVKEKRYGLFASNRGYRQHQETTTDIPMQVGIIFGVQFSRMTWDSDAENNLIFYRWTKILPSGETIVVRNAMTAVYKSADLGLYYTIEEADLTRADLKLEMLSMDKTLIYSKVFKVQEIH